MKDIYYRGLPIENADHTTASTLRLLINRYRQRRSFRMINQSSMIIALPGYDHIECTTGGSSGVSKVVRRHFRSWQRSFAVNQRLFHLTQTDRYAVFGRLNHSLSLYGVCEALWLTIPLEILSDMLPRRQKERLSASSATVLYITPTQLRLLSAVEGQCPAVRLILCGGSKLDSGLRQQAMRSFPNARLYEFYGSSETSFITLSDDTTPDGSVGKAYPGVQIAIRNPIGGIGEVWVSSPYLFDGYAEGGSSETQSCQGFLTVGELGRLDDEGYLWLLGRQSRMVTSSDKNVHPELVESVISRYTGTALCAVVAKPDPLRGHVLHAFIEGSEHMASEAKLRRLICQQLGREMEPRRFFYLAELPVLASGKPDIKKLAAYGIS